MSSVPPPTGRRLLVGLGNPGERYAATRHNLGFRVVERLADRWRLAFEEAECRCRLASAARVELAMPMTFMNRSGHAVRCLVDRHGYSVSDILVIYDDVNLPLGRIRLRPSGSPGGHRGMESVIESLRCAEVARLRLGVASEEMPSGDLVDFVLSPFLEAELEVVREQIERAAEACEAWMDEGAAVAMSRFNG